MHLSVMKRRLSMPALWRRQVGRQLKARRHMGGRGFAVVRFVPAATGSSKLVDIQRLAVCVLQDEFEPGNYPQIRFAAYRLAPVPWGITIGGREQVILDRDLASPPRGRAYGRRFTAHDRRWLPLALRLDKCLARHARHPHAPTATQLRFPRFWVALRTAKVTCDGPEFAKLCDDFGISAEVAQLTCARRHHGQILFPIEFAGHLWREFTTIYADLQYFFLRQVIRVDGSEQLANYVGACRYDLLSSPHWWRHN
jgi:hypothetical protein